MDSTGFEYTVSSSLHAIYDPLTADLTCAEVVRRRIRLETKTSSLSLPDQTIVHHTSFIPLYAQNDVVRITRGTNFLSSHVSFSLNRAGISHIMSRFGVANDCSTISREIDETLRSISWEGKGVTQVKIWKINTKVYEIDRDSEKLLMGRCCSVPADDSHSPVIDFLGYNTNGSTGCVICMEDYNEGSIVVKLPCDHDFHGVCINQWSHIKYQCPSCRLPISPSSSFSFFLWIFDL